MNGQSSQSTSSRQDWVLDRAQLEVAARISLANASSTTDITRRREDAMRAALAAKLPVSSDLLQAEMDAMEALSRSVAESMTAEETPLPRARRPASPLPEDAQPAAKRQRPAPAASKSAAERFLEASELATLAFKHLVYDRIDLTSLSKVSKRCRSSALPLLVECLNIPFTKADTFSALFHSNPGLVAHVKFLRLWDDVAEETSRRRRSDPAHKLGDAGWAKLGKLLAHFESASLTSGVMVELSVGQVQLFDVRTQFLKAPRLLGRLVSLRIVDDVFPATTNRFDNTDLYDSTFPRFSAQLAQSLTLLLHECLDRQDGSGVPLRIFAMTVPGRFELSTKFPELGPRLSEKLASSLTHLKLGCSVGPGGDVVLRDLLVRQWPELESIDFCFADPEYVHEVLGNLIGRLIQTNPGIHSVRAAVWHDVGREVDVDWCNMAQPNQLTTLDLYSWRKVGLTTPRFAQRHKAIRDLTLHSRDDAYVLVNQQGFIQRLRVFRADVDEVDLVLRVENQVREVHIGLCWAPDDHERIGGRRWLDADISSSTVTFLSLVIKADEQYPLESVRSFPSLVELAVVIEAFDVPRSRSESTPSRALSTLSALLHRLESGSSTQASQLQALLVSTEAESPLPLSQNAYVTPEAALPPRLEYLTWISPDRNIQHFRVLASSAATDERTARLQILPAIFRPKVDRKTGFWEDVFDPRHGYALFDHLTGDEPRLKFA